MYHQVRQGSHCRQLRAKERSYKTKSSRLIDAFGRVGQVEQEEKGKYNGRGRDRARTEDDSLKQEFHKQVHSTL